MKIKLIYIIAPLLIFSCSLFNEPPSRHGYLTIGTDRALSGDLEIKFTHSDGTSETFQGRIGDVLKVRLKSGKWDILLNLMDSTGNITYKGSSFAEVSTNSTVNIHIPMFPVGNSTLNVSFSYSSSLIDNIEIKAISKFDTSKTYNLYSGLPFVFPYTTSPVNIESGGYDIIATAFKGTEVIGGLIETVTIGANENATVNLNNIPASSENVVRNNSVIRLNITSSSGPTDDIVSNRVLTYILNSGKYDLTYSDELKDYPRDSGVDCTYFVYPKLSNLGVPIGKGMKVIISQGRYTGEIDLKFSSDFKGSYTFNLSSGGILSGNFYYYTEPFPIMFDYYIHENPNVLIDFGNAYPGKIEGIFNQNIKYDGSSYFHSFIPQPTVNLANAPAKGESSIAYDEVQVHNPKSIDIYDESSGGIRKIRVDFGNLGYTNTITYHFFSRYRGIADYSLYDSLGNSFTGVAPFSFANYKSEYFISNGPSTTSKPYRNLWDYVKEFQINGLYILEDFSPYTFNLNNSDPTNYDLQFFNKQNSPYNNVSIHAATFGTPIADIGAARIFDDCDILGVVGSEIIIKGKVYNSTLCNTVFGASFTSNDGDSIYIKLDYNTHSFKVYTPANYSSLFIQSPIGSLVK